MTISISWRRRFLGVDEILFASDSRLSAGYRWDCAQKIFPIDGPNFCISFAGDADFGFPCLFQFQCMVRNYRRFTTGAAPIGDMAKDFLAICNQMLTLVDDRKIAQFNRTQFIISGYDFDSGEAYQKIVRFNENIGKYQRYNFGGFSSNKNGFRVGFVGDKRNLFFEKLGRLMLARNTVLNYQPLEALAQILEGENIDSPIGGSPQVVKVYRHRNYLPYAIRKKYTERDEITLFGRPLLKYERTFYPIVSLDRFGCDDFIEYPGGIKSRPVSPPPSL
nr:hypothetical protein [uncultured Dongia sp.]